MRVNRFGGKGILVCSGIILGSRTTLYIFNAGIVNSQCYRDEILEVNWRFFWRSVGPDYIFMDDNARLHRTHIVKEFHEEADIRRID
ncbi:transposable element Tc1 transposase [Trichonephila clavipes]|nr:transposable element Tc1 transposase [Trichonephila clavipes]